jgi:hypothetical protein
MSDGKVKGKQLIDIPMSPSETPLSIDSYTVSSSGSGKQLINKDYLETYVQSVTISSSGTQSLQQVTDVSNTTSNDLEITDFNSGVVLKSPSGDRWRITINDDGQLIAEQL